MNKQENKTWMSTQITATNQTLRLGVGHETYPRGAPFEFLKAPFAAGGRAGGAPGVEMFVPTISIFIGFPSSITLLYLLTAATASCLREKTTSAVP